LSHSSSRRENYFKNTQTTTQQDAIHDRPKSLRVRALQSDHETGTIIARFIFFVMSNSSLYSLLSAFLLERSDAFLGVD
jgi:hypothetical protein